MRRGLLRDVDETFAGRREMVRGSSDPDTWEAEEERIDALRDEVKRVLRERDALMRLAKAAIVMLAKCPTDDDATPDYWTAVCAFRNEVDRLNMMVLLDDRVVALLR